MSRICKNCLYYNTDRRKSGMCKNVQASDLGRLVWPNKEGCDYFCSNKEVTKQMVKEDSNKK